MPTMSRGTSFKAGFLYGEMLRNRRCREMWPVARDDGPQPGVGSRCRPSGRRIGRPVSGLNRATAAARSRTGIHRARTGPLLPASRRGRARAAPAWRCWCERGDSNPQGLPHWHLKPARLPIPPLSRSSTNAQYAVPEPWMGIVTGAGYRDHASGDTAPSRRAGRFHADRPAFMEADGPGMKEDVSPGGAAPIGGAAAPAGKPESRGHRESGAYL